MCARVTAKVDFLWVKLSILFPMELTPKDWDVRKERDWTILSISGRIDSFNYDPFCQKLQDQVKAGAKKLALDLSRVRFLSLPSIKYLTNLATQLEDNGGNFALLAASEKLKRQIDIYATLKTMAVVRTTAELEDHESGAKPKRAQIPSKAHLEI